MSYYYEEILQGFTELPSAGAPGTMVLTDSRAQAIFTGGNQSDVFLAAIEHGKGRVFVASQDSYYAWLRDKKDGLEGQFINSVKNWLTRGAQLDDSNTKDASKLKDDSDLSELKLIVWLGAHDGISEQLIAKFKTFVENGGGLFCSMTPWGYLQCNPKKTLNDIKQFLFLKDNFGIIYTDKYFVVPNRIPVANNKSKLSNFQCAIDGICSDVANIPTLCDTIDCGVDNLARCGLSTNRNQIEKMKKVLLEECKVKNWNPVPSRGAPVKAQEVRNVTKLLCQCYIELGEKAPNVEEFPFDFEQLPPLVTSPQMNLKSRFGERLSTGYYLPAGVEMNVKVTRGEVKDWKCRIGAHTDNLRNNGELCRWPNICVIKNVKKEFVVRSPFGGLIYFESPKNGDIDVIVSNVVETPLFDVTKAELSDWATIRQKPGLWAELAGEHIILTCPAKYIRELDDARAVTNFWDEVVKQHHKCRGTDPYEQKRERVVCDKQCGAGYMHSGYPVVTHLDISEPDNKFCIFNIERMRKHGNWGLFHEIGHNMQRGEWTFDGCGEVTVNIFSMHAMEMICNIPITESEFVLDRKREFERFFQNKPTYDQWKSECCMALMTFAQLIRHFGWPAMYQFMREYENDMKNNKKALPKTNQEKIDQWVARYSRIVGHNIRPQFEIWGLPVTDAAVNEQVASLPPFNPQDEINAEVFFRPMSFGDHLVDSAIRI